MPKYVLRAAESDEIREDDIILNFTSKAMPAAIIHGKNNIEQAMEELLITWLGPYEDAKTAVNWTERHAIYARNGLRKATRIRMQQWLNNIDI